MSSTFSPNLGLELPGLGDYVNGWNVPVNGDFTTIDTAFGGQVAISTTGGTVTLTAAQCAVARIYLSGTLASNLTVVAPSTFGGRIYFYNGCVLGSYTAKVRNGASDARGGVTIPNNLYCPVVFTANAAFYDNYQSVPPGVIQCYAGSAAPPGFLFCDGTGYSTTTYADLFAAIAYTYGGAGGTFNVPDTRGRLLAGADNMGGSAANRLTGYTLATTGGEQTHTLTTGELAAHSHGVTDPGHTHSVTDPTHSHTVNNVVVGNGGIYSFATSGTGTTTNQATTAATTGISIVGAFTNVTTQNAGGGGAHNNIQPTIAINHIIRF